MANIKSAKKRILTNKKAQLRNKAKKSSMRTAMKSIETLIHESKKEEAMAMLSLVTKKLDKAVTQGIVHKNYASRQKSRLTLKINSL